MAVTAVFTQQVDCPLGNLNSVPPEVLSLMLSHMSIRDLSVLSITSKAARNAVEEFCIKPETGFRNIVSNKYLNGAFIDHKKPDSPDEELRRYVLFREIGCLIKRSTCLYPTQERLKIVFDFLRKVYGRLPCVDDVAKIGTSIRFWLKCIGIMLHTVINGWDESECEVVFSLVEERFQAGSVVNKCLLSKVGHCKNDEYFIRSYFRMICLEFCPTLSDRAFWLSLILQLPLLEEKQRTESRAKILMLIYGPLISQDDSDLPTIAWWDLTDSFFIDNGLKEIALGVHLLHGHLNESVEHKQDWTRDEIVAIVDKIIVLPDRWLPENIACFLFYCGKDLVELELKKRLDDGHLPDVANYLVYLTLVTHKLKVDTKWIIDLIDTFFEKQTCQNIKRSLILEIPIAFNEALSDIEHMVDVDDERDVTDLHDMTNALISLMKALLQKAYPVSGLRCTKDGKNEE